MDVYIPACTRSVYGEDSRCRGVIGSCVPVSVRQELNAGPLRGQSAGLRAESLSVHSLHCQSDKHEQSSLGTHFFFTLLAKHSVASVCV